MRGRHRLGLRSRLLAAMVAVAALTIFAAALALLPSLQGQLKAKSQEELEASTLESISRIQRRLAPARPAEVAAGSTTVVPKPTVFSLQPVIFDLRDRIDGRVVITDVTPTVIYDTENGTPLPRRAIYRAIVEDQAVTTEVDGVASYVVPLRVGNADALLIAQKRLTDVAAAVDRVREAFITAALVGLAAAVVLALGLAATLSRRLQRLRQAAVRISAEGVDAPPPPPDAGHDEVGDLARALTAMHAGLRRQEEARRAFVATASHELRTPLTSLGWALELLRDDLEGRHLDVEDARTQVVGAQVQLSRLQRLAAELLDLSRLDADVELRSEPVELGELARAVAAEFDKRAREVGVAVEVVPPPGPCWGRGDPGALAQVVRILLDNALRFAPGGSAVRVVPAYSGESATVAVEDGGPGVPPDEAERIFERFERGSRTGGEGGFGLGLAIGRELARRQGGDLALTPLRDRRPGARFVLRLPIELPTGTHEPADRAAGAGTAVGSA